MKIAAVTDDGTTISRHFGSATYYVVSTVENGRVVRREQRQKPACEHHAGNHVHHDEAVHVEHDHVNGDHSPDLHARMTDVIADCEAVVAGGIPRPMYQHLIGAGIRPLLTDIPAIDDAVAAYLAASPAEPGAA